MEKQRSLTHLKQSSIPSDEYSASYFHSDCHGYEEFNATHGVLLPKRLHYPLKLANLSANMRVLDLGCGRGELTFHCAKAGAYAWGVDYAEEALKFTRKLDAENVQQKMGFQRANAVNLPYANNSFDIIFMLDVVEHLFPSDLTASLDEVRRVLKNHGQIIIHTMPNLWYYNFGYPIFRIFQKIRGKNLPINPRARNPYTHLHVNEQSPIRIKKALKTSLFYSSVWLKNIQDYSLESNIVVRRWMRWLATEYPFKWIFCNDIFAIGTIENENRH